MRQLTVRGWGTLAAVIVFVAVVIATLASVPVRPSRPAPSSSAVAETDALARCHALGPAAESDAGCHQTWRALSDHFLGIDRKAGGHE